MLKETDSGYTLLAANLEGRPMGVGYRFTRNLQLVRRLNPDRTVTPVAPEGAEFRDALGAFGAAVYEIRLR
jgi:hypothetical protein